MKPLPLLTMFIVAVLLAAGVAVLAADRSAGAALTKFTSDDELRAFLEKHTSRLGGSKGPVSFDNAEAAATSGTNTQVAGVDEGDMVKTDGSIIFIARGNEVHLIATSPELGNLTTIIVGEVGGDNYTFISGIYVWEGRLVVVYTEYEYRVLDPYPLKDAASAMYYPYWSMQRTEVQVYDVRDPAHPVVGAHASVSGYLTTSRMIGATLYVVADQSVWADDIIMLPEVSVNGSKDTVPATSISYDPSCPEVSSFINLLAFDITNGVASSQCILAGPSSTVYMSETALYVTMQRWSVMQSWTFSRSAVTTGIYRVAVDGTDLRLGAQGEVDGTLLNQFALDEYNGRLRVATTTYSSQGLEVVNSVRVLDLGLNEVGTLDDIAPGEMIYSSRFMGDRLYLVTFRQVDPLFVIDLTSDTPAVLGQLKIPGVSTYLQMVEEGLVGIGLENGTVKVSLFDVSDPQRPIELGTYVEEGPYSYSAAQYDHHAVLYDERSGKLVIPVSYYTEMVEAGWTYYRPVSSAVVLQLGTGGIDLIGKVVHDNATVQRSFYIGEVLYTISDATVKANSLTDLSPLGELRYAEDAPYYGGYGYVEKMAV